MSPKCRGNASTVALVVAAVTLLASLWLTFGKQDPGPVDKAREPAREGPVGPGLIAEADALSMRLADGPAVPDIPPGLRFRHRPPPDTPAETPPSVGRLEGRMDGFSVLLTWSPGAGQAAGGYLIERIAEDGTAEMKARLPAKKRTWRSDPVAALFGTRSYRVAALDRDGEVSKGRRRECVVDCRIPFDLECVGVEPGGATRWAVVIRAGDEDEKTRREFTVAPGGILGGILPAEGPVPEMDWSTGLVYRGLRARRLVDPVRTDVPRFAPDGSPQKDAKTGEWLVEQRTVPMSRIVEEAGLFPRGTPENVKWHAIEND